MSQLKSSNVRSAVSPNSGMAPLSGLTNGGGGVPGDEKLTRPGDARAAQRGAET
jgi:hypothetical protein